MCFIYIKEVAAAAAGEQGYIWNSSVCQPAVLSQNRAAVRRLAAT